MTDPGSDAVGSSREDAPTPDGGRAGARSGGGDGFRSRGMRDLGPERMRRFRRVEARFLEVASAAGYREIRTPTVEPLHLFTGAGALSPQLLDRVYSFLDWDGWSGERVVLRPDSTLPAVRWFEGRAGEPDEPSAGSAAAARLCYVQPVYRFSAGDEPRELWQCGVELFGLAAPEGDAELLGLARGLLAALGLGEPRFELAHAGLLRAALAGAGLDAAEQVAVCERLIAGDEAVVRELAAARPERAGGLRLLLGVRGRGEGYLDNAGAALRDELPEAAAPLAELRAAARALAGAGSAFELVPATAANFEYYTGLTFRAFAAGEPCLAGGRYDRLAEAVGGRPAPASGFAADLLRLADLAPAEPSA